MDLATKQYLIALGVFALGLSGWLLPYKWNILKLKRTLAKHLSERANQNVARAFGTVLMFVGIVMVAVTAYGGDYLTR